MASPERLAPGAPLHATVVASLCKPTQGSATLHWLGFSVKSKLNYKRLSGFCFHSYTRLHLPSLPSPLCIYPSSPLLPSLSFNKCYTSSSIPPLSCFFSSFPLSIPFSFPPPFPSLLPFFFLLPSPYLPCLRFLPSGNLNIVCLRGEGEKILLIIEDWQ